MTIWAVLPAAGVGRRVGSSTPKQYLDVGATPLILHSLRRLSAVSAIEKIIVVVHPDDCYWSQLYSSIEAEFEDRIESVIGGDERYQSVLNGLLSLATKAKSDDWVLVHDAVRPCIRKEDINKLIEEVADDKVGGILANRIVDTVKQINNGGLVSTIDRQKLYIAQTPQMFRYAILKDSIEKAIESNMHITDESEALESLNYSIRIVEGSSSNIKITTQEDIHLANYFLKHHEY